MIKPSNPSRRAWLCIVVSLGMALTSPWAQAEQSPELIKYEAFKALLATAPPAESEAGTIARQVQLDQTSRFAIISLIRQPQEKRDVARFEALRAEITSIDATNTALVRPLVTSGRWMSRHYSTRTQELIWIIVQHSPDKDLQKVALRQIEPLAISGRFGGEFYAGLYDRVAIREGRLQRYGTQFKCYSGKYELAPLEDPTNVVYRRTQLHFLETFSDTTKEWSGTRC